MHGIRSGVALAFVERQLCEAAQLLVVHGECLSGVDPDPCLPTGARASVSPGDALLRCPPWDRAISIRTPPNRATTRLY
jgi:hypothetical protein